MQTLDTKDKTQSDLRASAQALADAERRGDADFLADALTDDFTGVGPRGYVLNKAQWLARYTSGDLKHTAFAWDNVTVSIHNDDAIMIARQIQESTYQGRPAGGTFRITMVFVRQDGRWLLAGAHLSPLENR